MNLYLAALLFYSVFLMALGIFISRRVKNSSDFLVAGRSLGPGRFCGSHASPGVGQPDTPAITEHVNKSLGHLQAPEVLTLFSPSSELYIQ